MGMRYLYECKNCNFYSYNEEKYGKIPCMFEDLETGKYYCDTKNRPIKKLTKEYQYIIQGCPLEKKNNNIEEDENTISWLYRD